jgi:molybdenum cofactor biosynthesis enzyme
VYDSEPAELFALKKKKTASQEAYAKMSLLQNSMTAKLLCHERQQLGKLFAYKVTAELFALKKTANQAGIRSHEFIAVYQFSCLH